MRIENLDWGNRVIFVPDSKSRRTTTRADEPSCRRAFACTLLHENRRLGVSVQPCRLSSLIMLLRFFEAYRWPLVVDELFGSKVKPHNWPRWDTPSNYFEPSPSKG